MARIEEEFATLLIDKAPSHELDESGARQPTVLSCGGIYIPRPKPMGPNDEIYRILNVANTSEPTKVVGSGVSINLLQDVLHKESMN